MAKEEKKQQDNEAAGNKRNLSTVKIIIITAVLSLVIGGGLVGATFYFVSNMNDEQTTLAKDDADESSAEEAGEDAVEDVPKGPPQYHSMDPQFVVSFSDQRNARFMQFSLEIMSHDSEVIKLVEAHMPVIRSSLLMLFGSQTYEDMVTREGKEQLLNNVKNDINTTLQTILGEDELESTVDAAYFNSFVIQ